MIHSRTISYLYCTDQFELPIVPLRHIESEKMLEKESRGPCEFKGVPVTQTETYKKKD